MKVKDWQSPMFHDELVKNDQTLLMIVFTNKLWWNLVPKGKKLKENEL